MGWSNHAVGLLHGLGIDIPQSLSNGDALIAQITLAMGFERTPDLVTATQVGGYFNLPAVLIAGLVTLLLILGTTESARVNAVMVAVKVTALIGVHRPDRAGPAQRQFTPFHADRWRRRAGRGVFDLLRLCRVRCGVHRGGGNQEPATQCADRSDRQSSDLHRVLSAGCNGCDRCDGRAACDLGSRCDAVARLGRDRRPLRGNRIKWRCAAFGLLERSACPCSGYDRVAGDRPPCRSRRGARAAICRADDDVRPDARVLRHGT